MSKDELFFEWVCHHFCNVRDKGWTSVPTITAIDKSIFTDFVTADPFDLMILVQITHNNVSRHIAEDERCAYRADDLMIIDCTVCV